jgi:branched-chain amino acid transport system substrate-binding protein
MSAFKAKFGADPDQFAAQAYDAMYILASALNNVTLTNNLEKDRAAIFEALPKVKHDGATGKFEFVKAPNKGGKEAGYDAKQDAVVNIAKDGKFVLLK